MDDEIQLISDGYGLTVHGDYTLAKEFLVSENLWSSAKDLTKQLNIILSAGSLAAQVASEISAGSSLWVQITKESARQISKHGLRTSSKTGLSTGVLKGEKGQIGGFVEFARVPGSRLSPQALSGVAGIMAQVAMQQSMAEITAYLARIEEKIGDLHRDLRNQALARLDGADLMIEEAMAVRERVGRVDEVTWSTVQDTPSKIRDTQAYALRQLNDLVEKTERKSKISDLADALTGAEHEIRMWLFVLARCCYLQNAFDVLRLDRVLGASPEELDQHRLGLKAARQKLLETITQATEHLLARVDAAARKANTKVLWHPTASPAVVRAGNDIAAIVHAFHELLGIEADRQSWEAKPWREAVTETKDKVLETGAEGVDTAKQLGTKALGRARSVTAKISSKVGERTSRRRAGENELVGEIKGELTEKGG
ncbi:hypothetical protein [Thermomonospora curvata]|uniref:Uncharacterized protein n=1 Tax=Thermomonospora curvata (strain ATCC 19995 / DSM 43183 / JCM 3096 / KCTC 9072 / NBRC 15933 / NCIMB 10081 / Henssen B9) TaxID=471852 RepID=D1ADP8_THECD|nr:hypothetical protein [Thermomonospora curvata]ACY97508.1 hypothetical protein Tcur_1939 [Thermomonospora curvata DSM 43183]